METATVARKQSKTPAQPRKAVAVTIKGSEEWRDWVEEAATHCRISVSALVDLAITQYVKGQGFAVKPPKR